jgi:hypothetical protein
MSSTVEQEGAKLDQIMESLDLPFERVSDVGLQQQQMKKQIENTVRVVDQQAADQQLMAKQLAETGRAVAGLTLKHMRDAESTESDTFCFRYVISAEEFSQRGEVCWSP